MKDPNRRFLLTTPGGLGALNRALPRSTQVDPQAALLLDQAFLDAYLAHRLLDWATRLARSANEVLLDCQPRQDARKATPQPGTAHPSSLTSLAGVLKTVQSGYKALSLRTEEGKRTCLNSTNAGLQELRKALPCATLQGPDGFLSLETMLQDALAAQDLEAAMLRLFQTAAIIHQDCLNHQGKPSLAAFTSLQVALVPLRRWNWDAPRIASPCPGGRAVRSSAAKAEGHAQSLSGRTPRVRAA